MTIDRIFLEHRTCYNFSDKEVAPSLLQEIYDIAKHGSTSFNCSPLRIIFIQSPQKRQMLLDCLMPGNVEKTRTAPLTAIFAYDLHFYNKLEQLFPPMPTAANFFNNNSELAAQTAMRNSSLQAAYFMMVARDKGLECGPMSGFNDEMIRKHFIEEENIVVNFLCNFGYKGADSSYPPLPRLDFAQSCKVV
jgi:nitroreductase